MSASNVYQNLNIVRKLHLPKYQHCPQVTFTNTTPRRSELVWSMGNGGMNFLRHRHVIAS